MADPKSDAQDPNVLTFKASSNIREARFEPANGQVAVKFANGQTFIFQGFTADLMKEWAAASSPGGWFNSNVKSHPDKFAQLGRMHPGDDAPRGETLAPPLSIVGAADHADDGGTGGPPRSNETGTPVRGGQTIEAVVATGSGGTPSSGGKEMPRIKDTGKSWRDRPWTRGPNGTTSK